LFYVNKIFLKYLKVHFNNIILRICSRTIIKYIDNLIFIIQSFIKRNNFNTVLFVFVYAIFMSYYNTMNTEINNIISLKMKYIYIYIYILVLVAKNNNNNK